MKIASIIIASSIGACGAILGGGWLLMRGTEVRGPSPGGDAEASSAELESVRQELAGLRETLDDLVIEVRGLRSSQRIARMSGEPEGSAAEASAAQKETGAAAEPEGISEAVAVVLAEERKIQEAERQRQREERRVRSEERRKETEAMQQGPYGRYNLKVNSLAKTLAMTDVQKQSYYDLVNGYRTRLEEGIKQLRESRRTTVKEGTPEGQRNERPEGGGDREKFRELTTSLSQGFAAGMQSILSQEQYGIYTGLSRSSQSFQDLGMVAKSGQEENRSDATRFFPGGGGPGGGRTRGGGGGSRPAGR